jgi:co-chaperonin GroES (HSP10)
VKITPVNSKVQIKLETAFDETTTDEKGNKFYKTSKDSRILITEKAGEQKDKKFQVATVVAIPAFVKNEQDWMNNITYAPVQFKVGDKVIVTGGNVSTLSYKGQTASFIPADMVWGIVE